MSLARNLSALMGANVVNGILGLVFVPVAVRQLGTEGFGVYSVYPVLAGYFVLAELGLGKHLLRELAASEDVTQDGDVLRNVLGVYVVLAALALLSIPFVVWLVETVLFRMPAEFRGPVRVVTIFACLDYVLGLPVAILQGYSVARERMGPFSRFTILAGLLRYSLALGAVLALHSASALVAVLLLRRAIEIPLARRVMGDLPKGAWRPRFERGAMGQALRRSAGLSVAQFLQLTAVSIGSMLVNAYSGVGAMGAYRAAYELASRVWFFSNTAGRVLFPRFVRLLWDDAGRGVAARALPALLEVSWSGYAVLIGGVVLFAAPLTAFLGIAGHASPLLVPLVFAGVSFNAHANTGYEVLQALRRDVWAIGVGALSVSLFVAIFLLGVSEVPAVIVGLAWLGSQLPYALVTDALVIGAVTGKSGRASLLWRVHAVVAVGLLATLTALATGRAELALACVLFVIAWAWRTSRVLPVATRFLRAA